MLTCTVEVVMFVFTSFASAGFLLVLIFGVQSEDGLEASEVGRFKDVVSVPGH